jgi:predicted enzyme related to lactoylglutathione lyase
MTFPIVFMDLAGPDDAALRSFYSSVFQWDIDDQGRFDIAASGSIPCAIRQDPAEKRVYIGVPDVAGHLSSIEAAGGTIDAPRFEVPGVVVLGLFRDPAGNPMGLIEMDGDKPRIP